MKKRRSDTAKPRLFLHDTLFRAAGVLFLLVMISIWLVCSMYAKYVISYPYSDAAHVAGGAGMAEVWEHQAVLENGEYRLTKDKVTDNSYMIIPGVDIPKDPFISFSGLTEAPFELYLQVTESKDFPTEFVTYKVDTQYWELTSEADKIYKYKGEITSKFADKTLSILKQIGNENREIKVSEHYVGTDDSGKPVTFTLKFNVWLVQKQE